MTHEKTPLDIVKSAILLEHKGKALYDSVVEATSVPAVKELFEWLSREEVNHIAVLEKQYRRLAQGRSFDASGLEEGHTEAVDSVLSHEIIKRVSGAGYEAAVISAALEFEKGAVAYYSKQAGLSDSQEAKDVFGWLSRWETTHMQMLSEVDDGLKEEIWYDNQFWPLD
jgi:rubrerythrin